MTPNTVRTRLAFSFRAEDHNLDTRIDLDCYAAEAGEAPAFPLLLDLDSRALQAHLSAQLPALSAGR